MDDGIFDILFELNTNSRISIVSLSVNRSKWTNIEQILSCSVDIHGLSKERTLIARNHVFAISILSTQTQGRNKL